MWSGYFRVPQGLTDWHTRQAQKTVESVTHTFEAGNFEFAVPIESYATLEYFYAGPLKINTVSSYIFVAVLAIMSIMIFAIITTFPRFWFYVGTGLLVLFIVSMRLDVLGLFGQRNFIATIVYSCHFLFRLAFISMLSTLQQTSR